MCVCVYVCVSVSVCVCIKMYVYICMCKYKYINIYIYLFIFFVNICMYSDKINASDQVIFDRKRVRNVGVCVEGGGGVSPFP
jgi:hypothetical protein